MITVFIIVGVMVFFFYFFFLGFLKLDVGYDEARGPG